MSVCRHMYLLPQSNDDVISPLGWMRSSTISASVRRQSQTLSVCLSVVCLSVCSPVFTTKLSNSTEFSTRVIQVHGSVFLWRQWNTLCTAFLVLWMKSHFSIMGPMACGIGNIYVNAVPERVVANFHRIRQVAPQCLTSSYTMAMAANCAPEVLAMTTSTTLHVID